MMHKRGKKLFKGISVGVLLLEFLSILVAIFLGNLAADWNKESNERKEAQKSLALICKELDKNHEELEYYLKYYHRMIVLLDSVEAINEFEQFFELDEFQHINPPAIYTFAYDIGQSSGRLANIEHEQAVVIARVYLSLQGLQKIIEESQLRVLKGELEGPEAWRQTLNFFRQPIELFYRDYPMLNSYKVCPNTQD